MLGTLPQQGVDTPFVYNGFQGYVGVWNEPESGNFLNVVIERVKGGGQYGNTDSTTWLPIAQLIDPENKMNGTIEQDKAFLQSFLDGTTEKLKTHVGLGGAVTPPFPTVAIDQLIWLVKYSVTFNPATGKFLVV
jgi:hypothetical protein